MGNVLQYATMDVHRKRAWPVIMTSRDPTPLTSTQPASQETAHAEQSREAKRVTTIGAWLDAILRAVKVVVGGRM